MSSIRPLWEKSEDAHMEKNVVMDCGPMLNAYPDSIGSKLSDLVSVLEQGAMKEAFSSFYILPSLFHSDLDRGFSVIDYDLNGLYAGPEDMERIRKLGIHLKLDFVLNHASVLSKQFQDILRNGENSQYADFFINWNKFWEGCGEMTPEGYIQPRQELIRNMFFRKQGLPILMVRLPDGRKVPYWNTFYQEVRYPQLDAQDVMRLTGMQYGMSQELAELVNAGISAGEKPDEITLGRYESSRDQVTEYLESHVKYLGQMDLNIESPLVWEYYDQTLKKLSQYGAKLIRLDAFAYAPKQPGKRNFLNEPETWELLEKLQQLGNKYELTFLPEIHASYYEKTYEKLAEMGYMTYDFFLPGLIIDALEYQTGEYLKKWAQELMEKKIHVVNMLGCHDGIPLLDLAGMLPEERIEKLIAKVVERGGIVKDLHGQKKVYYQVNATYYSALGENEKALLAARAIQIFMPGKPQVWYLDLFAGKNDYDAVKRAGEGGHKEINRTNLSVEAAKAALGDPIVQKQLDLLQFRKCFPAFGMDAVLDVQTEGTKISFLWSKKKATAKLELDLGSLSFEISGIDADGRLQYHFQV